jgi:DNA-binding transcriptional MerR regulator
VLRYWEQEFPTLAPVKRRGNRRYYQHADVVLIRQIRSLLYEQGYTIGGARQRITESTEDQLGVMTADELRELIVSLEDVLDLLEADN